jgi:hypothetical protein
LGGGFQNENGDRFVCETGVYFYEMDHRGFGMILRQNRRFLQKNDSFVLRDAPGSHFGTKFAYSSAKTKKQWVPAKRARNQKR